MLNDFFVVCDGDINTQSGFTEKDHSILFSEAAVNKIRRIYARTPYKFNFYVLMHKNIDGGNKWRGHTKVLEELNSYGIKTNDPDCISVYYSNNATGKDYLPMTAWILAHRIHHATMVDRKPFPLMDIFEKETLDFIGTLSDNIHRPWLGRFGGDYKKIPLEYNFLLSTTNSLLTIEAISLTNLVFTMRSARENRLTNIIDFPAELLAQYIITGAIKFNLSRDWDVARFDKKNSFDEIYEIKNHQEVDDYIMEYELKLNRLCKEVLDSMVGKTTGW